MEFVVNNIQISTMFIDPLNFNFDFGDVSEYIRKNVYLFKGDTPLTIPSNNNNPLPIEIPRFTFQNNNGQLTMSALRIDFLSNLVSDDIIIQYINDMNTIIDKFNVAQSYRIGMVVNCTTDKEKLFSRLVNLIKFDDANTCPEIEFSYLRNKQNNNLKFNIWNRYFYNSLLQNNNFLIDVNNSAETAFNQNNIKNTNFVYETVKEVLNEFRSY